MSIYVVSDIGDLIWSFLELVSLLNKAARIPWPMGPDPGLKCDSMGRKGKEGVPSDCVPYWTEAL